jgi:cation:H+ antiporter
MDILVNIGLFIVGLILIVKGADWLTDGAASVARRFGIPSLVVGLTIVAMGSSAPELVVSVVAAIQGNVDMALGNVVGSNIFNILAIMGITAIVRPINVERGNIRNDVPFAVLSSFVIAVTAFDSFFSVNTTENNISRTDGLLMLCMFAIFISYTLSIASPAKTNSEEPQDDSSKEASLLSSTLWIIIGLACLILGGNWLVDGASGIASALGVSDSIIALTIVSAGTSAPELAASVMAARKGDTAMALGNVVGSCVFNVFFVLGTASTIRPLGIGGITGFDICTLLTASCILWLFCRFGKTHLTLTRAEGVIMTIMAVAYYTILVYNA